MDKKIKELEKIKKYNFKKSYLLEKALIHKSFDNHNNNEKLEFLGDRVLGLVISEKLLEVIKKKNVEYIVIGLPIGLKGQETSQTKIVREFAEEIRSLALPVYFQDERLSSLSAKKSLIEQNVKTGHNKSFIDSTAAAIFLQQFLDSKV